MKAVSSLFGPVALLVETAAQLTGYVEALNDTVTGKDTPKTTIRVTPEDSKETEDSDPTSSSTSKVITAVPTGQFKAVSAGPSHSCGLRTDNTITCWGLNNDGQADPPEGSFTAVTAGHDHSCGLRTDGTIVCWGINDYGESEAPGGSFSAVSAGNDYSCGLRTDGTVVCWGIGGVSSPTDQFKDVIVGASYSCGLFTDDHTGIFSDAYKVCWSYRDSPPTGSFGAISAGNARNSCGLLTDGTAVCWGRAPLIPPQESVSAISASSSQLGACVLFSYGSIKCWGSMRWWTTGMSFSAVSAGAGLPCGLLTDGAIVCLNRFGELYAPEGSFSAVSASSSGNACGLRSDGTVDCWGYLYQDAP